jgi:integrase
MASVFKRGSNKRYSISWFDSETEKWRERTGYTDKGLSQREGERLELESAKRAAGEIDPLAEHRKRPIREHLTDFIAKVTAGNRNSRYILQVENRIVRIIEGTGTTLLHQLDPVKIESFLSELRIRETALSGITRNEYISSIKAFTKWAVKAQRLAVDPLASLSLIERRAIVTAHPRRALSVDEIGKLLDAATRRPIYELQLIRRGKNRGQAIAHVRPESLAKTIRLGKNRRLAYLLAVWTGLRRSELKSVMWSDIDFGTLPVRIRLRAETTKSRRADTLAIHPQLEQELRAIRPADNIEDAPILSGVPGMKALVGDLKYAGIDPGTRAMGFVDFHSLRKSLSTMMAAAGMSQRARQAHMRHTDPRLTESTYMDERLLPIAAELSKLPAIPGANDAAPRSLPMTGTDPKRT